MKTTIKLTILLAALMSMASTKAFAYDIAVENAEGVMIYYNYISDGEELSITYLYDSYEENAQAYKGSIVIPEQVTYMDKMRKVTSIGKRAFNNCYGLTSITIPNSVVSIKDGAFGNCSSLTSITIPNCVTSIGSNVFSGCSRLTSVTIPNSVTNIGAEAFSFCNNLTSVTIPNSVTSIGGGLFSRCSRLSSVTLSNSVTIIGNSTFEYCSGLTSITIPNSVTIIRDGAFRGCTSLASVTIPNNVTCIESSAFQGCTSLSSVTIPNNVTSIGLYAFSGCSNLKTITIPEDITIINRATFLGCNSLTEIVIPAKVEYVYVEAFANCSALKSVTCLATTPPYAYDNSFSNYNIPLYVPTESINDYQATNPWSKFTTLKTLSGEDADRKCAKPTIYYSNGELSFKSETEGVTFQSTITDTDMGSYSNDKVQLTVTYHVSVYASKSGYQNSEVAEGTLCWIEIDPQKEGIEDLADGVNEVKAMPVLIQTEDGTISVQGASDGTRITVYGIDGTQAGSAVSEGGQVRIPTRLQKGSIALVKIGEKTIKITNNQ